MPLEWANRSQHWTRTYGQTFARDVFVRGRGCEIDPIPYLERRQSIPGRLLSKPIVSRLGRTPRRARVPFVRSKRPRRPGKEAATTEAGGQHREKKTACWT